MSANLLSAAFLATALVTGGTAAAETQLYIVQFADPPAADYAGGVAGLAAARVEGARFDAASEAAVRYTAWLRGRQDAALAAVGSPEPLYRYDTVVDGVAVQLDAAQVRKLATTPGVVRVERAGVSHVDTTRTPEFLGLTTPGGVWSQLVGTKRNRGDGVIIGVIDTGIQPENPSVYDRTNGIGVPVATGGRLAYGAPPTRWKGACDGGPHYTCNNKLIGARYFDKALKAAGMVFAPAEYADSARDSDGHGSHTSSTAGGNEKSPAIYGGTSYGAMAGVAPRARLANYKVCWTFMQSGAPFNNC